MAGVHAIPLAATTSEDWIWAGVSILVAIVAATIVNRLLARRGPKLAQAVVRGELRPEIDTRLRYLRRLLVSGILLVGIAVALLQFGGLNKLAASLLASGAIAAAIIGSRPARRWRTSSPGSCSRSRSRCASATG